MFYAVVGFAQLLEIWISVHATPFSQEQFNHCTALRTKYITSIWDLLMLVAQ